MIINQCDIKNQWPVTNNIPTSVVITNKKINKMVVNVEYYFKCLSRHRKICNQRCF